MLSTNQASEVSSNTAILNPVPLIDEDNILRNEAEHDDYVVHHGDALDLLNSIPDQSVHAIITDPPYFIDGMGDEWNNSNLQEKSKKAGIIGSLPVGMKFDPQQGRNFQRFMAKISNEAFRVLKPGGFFVVFSQARLYHRMAVAVEDSGFEVRDMLGWIYEGQAKAFSQDHFVRKMTWLTESQKRRVLEQLGGRKTPQLKPCIEPMVLAQKPREGTFIENWLAHETGLVDTTATLDGKFPGNLMDVPKPRKLEKGDDNIHLTVKPVRLIEHLVQLFTKEGQTVLDPFAGSGSHGVAAIRMGRKFIGFEIEEAYVRIANARLAREAV